MWVTSRLWLHISVYFYSCTFIFVFLWKRVKAVISTAHLSPPQPQSETRLRIQTLGGIHRRETEEHTSKLIYFISPFFGLNYSIVLYLMLFCQSKAAKPSSDPFPALNHQFCISQNLKCSFSLWPEIFSPPKYALQSNLTFHRFTSL